MNHFDVLSFREHGITYEDIASMSLDAPDFFPCGAMHQVAEVEYGPDGEYYFQGYVANSVLVRRPGKAW